MTILLDSHAFFWWTIHDRKLSPGAHAAIASEPSVFVSSVVAWELTNKVRSGKWPAAQPVAARFFDVVRDYGFLPLPISLEHAHLAGSMSGQHRDPFDRMLAAQAQVEGLRLVTADPAFRAFGVDVLW
jgi:PIN domain nuclease of toxin-antitoxin system